MTDSIRILHFADLHIGMERHGRVEATTGLNSRVMDYLRRLSDLVEFAIQQQVDLVIFAGDAYKNRDPNSTYRREFSWRMKDLADRGIPVVMVPGNHDLPAVANRASSIEIFDTLGVPNMVVLDRTTLKQIKARQGQDVQIIAVPYPLIAELVAKEDMRSVSLERLDQIVTAKLGESIQALAEQASLQPDMPTILVGHFSVDEAELGSERGLMIGRDISVPRSVLVDPTWDYVALGHIHKHQDLNANAQPPIVYSGSLERIDFGEEREAKGWVLAEIAPGHTRYEFITQHKRPARRFITIDCDCRSHGDPMQMVLDAIARRDVADAIVRVRLQLRPDQDALVNERTLRAALAETFAVAGIHRDIEPGVRSRLGEINVESLTPFELLDRYFQVTQVPEEQKRELLAHGKEIIQQVDTAD